MQRRARRDRCWNLSCSRAVGFPRRCHVPSGQSASHKLLLHATVAQKGIDLFQALAQSEVVNVPDDGGKLRAKFLRERNNLAKHEASL